MSKWCGLCRDSMATTIFGCCFSPQHPPEGPRVVGLWVRAAMGSTGTQLAVPRVALGVSHRAVQRGQALTAVPGTPGWLAFVPAA